MSSFKKLNQQDVYITSYVAKKSWTTSGINKREEGIYFLPFSKTATPTPSPTPLDCTCELTATFQRFITPDCTLELSGEHISFI